MPVIIVTQFELIFHAHCSACSHITCRN